MASSSGGQSGNGGAPLSHIDAASYANNYYTYHGGAHVNGFYAALIRTFDHLSRAAGLLGDAPLTRHTIKSGLAAVVSVWLLDPQFELATKSRLSNPEAKGQVEAAVEQGLRLHFEQHPDDLKRIIDYWRYSNDGDE